MSHGPIGGQTRMECLEPNEYTKPKSTSGVHLPYALEYQHTPEHANRKRQSIHALALSCYSSAQVGKKTEKTSH